MKDTVEVPIDLLIGLTDAASEAGYPIAGDGYDLIRKHEEETKGDKIVFANQMKTVVEKVKETEEVQVDIAFSIKSLLSRVGYTLPCIILPNIDIEMKKYLESVLDIFNNYRIRISEAIESFKLEADMGLDMFYPRVTPSGLSITTNYGCRLVRFASIKFAFALDSDPSEWTDQMEQSLKSRIAELQ